MSVATVGAAVIGAGAAMYASNKASKAQGKASDAAAASAAEDLAFQKSQYANAEAYMKGASGESQEQFAHGIKAISQSGGGYTASTIDQSQLGKGAFNSVTTLAPSTAHLATTAPGIAAPGIAAPAQVFTSDLALSDFDGFLESFKDAMGENSEALETFSRRYGNIMDNVSEGIMKVSQERLSASGREQLSLDADQMRRDITKRLNVANMNRSGINLELQDRMNMDVEKMARKVDVDSYGQAAGLQAQGTQTLNSMFGIGNQIQGRREGLNMTKGQGMLQNEQFNAQTGTRVNMYNASNQQQTNQYNAQQQQQNSQYNASNRQQIGMFNAQQNQQTSQYNAGVDNNTRQFNAQGNMVNSQYNAGAHNNAMLNNMQATNSARVFASQAQNTMYTNAAQMYANRSQSRLTANNSFYGGVAMPDASNVINAHNSAADAAGKSAAGFASAAGNLAGKAYDAYQNRPQTPAPAATPSYGGDPLDLF